MTRDEFMSKAIASGKSKDEIRRVYDSIESAGEFDDNQTLATQPQEQVKAEPQKQGFFAGIGSDLSKRGTNLMSNASREESFPEYAIQQTGELAGGVNDVLGRVTAPIGKAIGLGVKAIAPNLYEAGKKTGEAIGSGINKALPDLGRVMEGTSNQDETIRSIGNMLMLGGLSKAAIKPSSEIVKAVKPMLKEESSGIALLKGATNKNVSSVINAPEKRAIIFNERGSIDLSKTDIPDIDELAQQADNYKIGESSNPVLGRKQVKQQIGQAPKTPIGSGIDEGEAAVLSMPKSETAAPFTDYAIQSKKAMRRIDEYGNPVETPMDIVGKRGAGAFKEVKKIRQDIGEQKSQYLQKIDDAVINNGDFIRPDNLKMQWADDLNKVLGIYKDDMGVLRPAASGAKNEALIPEARKISAMIERLPNEMTAEQLDSFSANLNGFLTKRKQGTFNVKADQVDLMVGRLKDQINNELENKAKILLDKSDFDNYLNARKQYGNMIKIENELSKSLGNEVVPGSEVPSRGAAIMKRAVQSNADAGSKALFKAVKDLTGIDLIQEAHYADIAMRAAGDPRMNNLLESVGLLKDIAGGKAGMVVKAAKIAHNKFAGDKLDRLIDFYNKAQKQEQINKMATLSPLPIWQEFDDNGIPLDGALLYTYAAGTSTDKDTFTDSSGSVANPNPVVFDSAGRASIWLGSGAYHFILKDKNLNTIWDKDDIKGVETLATTFSINELKALQSGQSDLVYVAGYTTSGDGGGGWFRWDADNTDADNGGTIIVPAGGGVTGRWLRFIENNQINPRWFGAVGDGVTNDAVAFANADNYAYSNGYELVCDAGTYLLSADPDLQAKVILLPKAILKSANLSITLTAIIDPNDDTQHFDLTGTGGIIFAIESTVNATWFGTSRTASEISRAIFSVSTNGGIVRLTVGTFTIAAVVNLNSIPIDIQPNCQMVISPSCAPINMKVRSDLTWYIINAAQADVPVLLNTEIRPIWFNNDLNKCLKALPVTGGDILLDIYTYSPILVANMRANVRFIGKRRPNFNSDLIGLTGGSIIKGPFLSDFDNVELHSLGIDSGVAVCTALYSGVYQDAIGIYNNASIIGTPPMKGIVVKNVIALCFTFDSPVHACLLQNVDRAIVDDVHTCFGVHGFVLKGTRSIYTNIVAKNHSGDGLIIRNNDYAPCSNNLFSNIYIEDAGFATGGVIIDNDTGVSDLENINIANLQCIGTTFGISLIGLTSPTYTIKNITIVGDRYDGVDTSNLLITSGTIDAGSIFFMGNAFNATQYSMGINRSVDIMNELYHRKNISVFNKAGSGWVAWASRDVTGSEAQVNLSNIKDLDINQYLSIRSNVQVLNKAATGWLTLATRNVANAEAIYDLSHVRILQSRGGDVASVDYMTLGSDGNYFKITGTATIHGIATAGWSDGCEICLALMIGITVKNHGTPSAGYGLISLSGNGDLTAGTVYNLSLRFYGSSWVETGRTSIVLP